MLGIYSRSLAAFWLFAASVFFYGWWNPVFIGLLLTSVVFNYGAGVALSKERGRTNATLALWILRLGIAVDLGLLGYYKYANFFVQNIDAALNLNWHIATIFLPLGISFFTFTQIAFLVDSYRGEAKETNFIHYGLFVTYFPHLIAGPVLHHKEMMPQFSNPVTYRINWENLSVGLTIFAIGLFKKVVLADGIAPFAAPVFDGAAHGNALTLLESWGGALAYTFQLYFDFSGYSDMAIGLSRLFGVKLPLNFNSPYKSLNIIEFWRRWHMTLSRFLRDYLYFALGGNKRGSFRRFINLMVTMVLGGLWHGAGWTFIIWGALHGFYLVINHGWQQGRKALGHDLTRSSPFGRAASLVLTFLAVVVAWVFFRAPNVDAAMNILRAMAGLNGLSMQVGSSANTVKWVLALWALAWLAPNSQQIMARFEPTLEVVTSKSRILWQPSLRWLVVTVFILTYSVIEMGKVSEFLYFQF